MVPAAVGGCYGVRGSLSLCVSRAGFSRLNGLLSPQAPAGGKTMPHTRTGKRETERGEEAEEKWYENRCACPPFPLPPSARSFFFVSPAWLSRRLGGCCGARPREALQRKALGGFLRGNIAQSRFGGKLKKGKPVEKSKTAKKAKKALLAQKFGQTCSDPNLRSNRSAAKIDQNGPRKRCLLTFWGLPGRGPANPKTAKMAEKSIFA